MKARRERRQFVRRKELDLQRFYAIGFQLSADDAALEQCADSLDLVAVRVREVEIVPRAPGMIQRSWPMVRRSSLKNGSSLCPLLALLASLGIPCANCAALTFMARSETIALYHSAVGGRSPGFCQARSSVSSPSARSLPSSGRHSKQKVICCA